MTLTVLVEDLAVVAVIALFIWLVPMRRKGIPGLRGRGRPPGHPAVDDSAPGPAGPGPAAAASAPPPQPRRVPPPAAAAARAGQCGRDIRPRAGAGPAHPGRTRRHLGRGLRRPGGGSTA